ncbi:MAG: hypothetical protein IPO40_05560 [Fibrobacteres bacterium]|nr:hypothetical protein [Fibrobacterota bacterium]
MILTDTRGSSSSPTSPPILHWHGPTIAATPRRGTPTAAWWVKVGVGFGRQTRHLGRWLIQADGAGTQSKGFGFDDSSGTHLVQEILGDRMKCRKTSYLAVVAIASAIWMGMPQKAKAQDSKIGGLLGGATPKVENVVAAPIHVFDANNIDSATYPGKKFLYSVEKIDGLDSMCQGRMECLVLVRKHKETSPLNRFVDTGTHGAFDRFLSKIGGTRSISEHQKALKFNYMESFDRGNGGAVKAMHVCVEFPDRVSKSCASYKLEKAWAKRFSHEQVSSELLYLIFSNRKNIPHENDLFRYQYDSQFSKYSAPKGSVLGDPSKRESVLGDFFRVDSLNVYAKDRNNEILTLRINAPVSKVYRLIDWKTANERGTLKDLRYDSLKSDSKLRYVIGFREGVHKESKILYCGHKDQTVIAFARMDVQDTALSRRVDTLFKVFDFQNGLIRANRLDYDAVKSTLTNFAFKPFIGSEK